MQTTGKLLRCTLRHSKNRDEVLTIARLLKITNIPQLNMGKNLTPKQEEDNDQRIQYWKRRPEVLPFLPTYEEACQGYKIRPFHDVDDDNLT